MDLVYFNLPLSSQQIISITAHDAASMAARLNAQFAALAAVPPPSGESAVIRGVRLGASSDGGKWSALLVWDFETTAGPPVEGEILASAAFAVAVEGDGSSDTEVVSAATLATLTGKTLGAALARALNAAAQTFIDEGEACTVRDVQDAGCNAGGRFLMLGIFEHYLVA